jgi:chloride channel protein, CIC family
MAAVFAGAARAPFTAILIVFEMTDDIQLILPLMAAVIFSMIVSERLLKDSIYTLKLTRRGIRLRRGRDVDVMENMTVAEAMRPAPKPIPGNIPMRMVPALLDGVRMHGLPVISEDGTLCGVVTVQDVEEAAEAGEGNLDLPVTKFCTQHPIVAYPDETLQRAIERMSHRDIGRLPVVDRNNSTRLVGWISRADIIRAYERALTRRVTVQQQVTEARLGAATGVDVIECEVEAGSALAGHTLSEIEWPQDSLVASIRRFGRLIIPHGKTIMEVGDQLSVVARRGDEDAVRMLARRSENLPVVKNKKTDVEPIEN